MTNRNTALIATIVAVVLCGCPGLLSLCWGLVAAFASFIPGADINIQGNTDPAAATTSGIIAILIGLVFIAIPALVWYFTMRRRPAAATTPGSVDVYNRPPGA